MALIDASLVGVERLDPPIQASRSPGGPSRPPTRGFVGSARRDIGSEPKALTLPLVARRSSCWTCSSVKVGGLGSPGGGPPTRKGSSSGGMSLIDAVREEMTRITNTYEMRRKCTWRMVWMLFTKVLLWRDKRCDGLFSDSLSWAH